jgi:hypothetical protein
VLYGQAIGVYALPLMLLGHVVSFIRAQFYPRGSGGSRRAASPSDARPSAGASVCPRLRRGSRIASLDCLHEVRCRRMPGQGRGDPERRRPAPARGLRAR